MFRSRECAEKPLRGKGSAGALLQSRKDADHPISGLPQGMEIAVGVNRHHLFARQQCKIRLGGSTGLQTFSLITGGGVNGDPLDIVLRQHGMLYRSHRHMDHIVLHGVNRDMLFASASQSAGITGMSHHS